MRHGSIRKAALGLPERFVHASRPPVALTAAMFAVLLLLSCTDAPLDHDAEYLIRVGERVATVNDFKRAFEITKSAYPQNLLQNAALLHEAQVYLLDQMIEELLVLQRAAELRLDLSDSEVAEAVAGIKADYPEGVFDQLLLESAVTYSFWEERLKIRLLLDKVVEQEVYRNISLSPEELAKFYQEDYEGRRPDSPPAGEQVNADELMVKQLRRQKAEEAYQLWIENLKEKYTVEINRKEWQRLTGL